MTGQQLIELPAVQWHEQRAEAGRVGAEIEANLEA